MAQNSGSEDQKGGKKRVDEDLHKGSIKEKKKKKNTNLLENSTISEVR